MKTQKIFSKKMIKDWSLYELQLNSYPIVSKQLGSIFKKWITTLDNPFSILWLRQLLENKLDYLEQIFAKFSTNNITLLEKVVDELNKENAKEDEIIKKILSISGELLTNNYLINKFITVKPMKEIGDFICNDETIVSVKTKSDMNFNKFIIAEYLRGLSWQVDYTLLRNFNYEIKCDGVSNNFRKNILNFLINDILDFINLLPEPQNEYVYQPIEKKYNEKLLVKGDKYYTNANIKIEINIACKENSIKMVLNKADTLFISFSNEVYYPDEEKYILAYIEKSIDE